MAFDLIYYSKHAVIYTNSKAICTVKLVRFIKEYLFISYKGCIGTYIRQIFDFRYIPNAKYYLYL
jgi:hypothetical protein